tara:strand:- start:1299 stop:1736 length:438 start_codon:yes stop_codon:yes gene_type:complete
MSHVTDLETGEPIFAGATSVGLRNVGSYQVSGHPFLTGSELLSMEEKRIDFPYVTKNITTIVSGSNINLRIHFNSADAPGRVMEGFHYISLDNDDSALTLDVKCTALYVTRVDAGVDVGGFQIMASLTNIPVRRMYHLTGSGLTD